jgi:hypothetical protein
MKRYDEFWRGVTSVHHQMSMIQFRQGLSHTAAASWHLTIETMTQNKNGVSNRSTRSQLHKNDSVLAF